MQLFVDKKKLSGVSFTVMILFFVIISAVGGAILNLTTPKTSVLYYSISALFPLLAISLVIFLFCKGKAVKPASLIGKADFNPLYGVVAIAVACGMIFGLGFLNYWVKDLLTKIGLNVSGQALKINNAGEFVLYSFLFALFPAVLEEMFFRGLMLDMMANSKPVFKILTVGLCFALYHLSLAKFCYQFIYGVILTLIALNSKSTLPCMLAHFINNFLVLCFEFFSVSINFFSATCIALGLLALVCGILLSILFCDKLKSKGEEQSVEETSVKEEDKSLECKGRCFDFYLPYGLIGIAVCVLTCVLGAVIK